MLRRITALSAVLISLSSGAVARAQEPKEAKWFERVKVAAFIDAYLNANFANPKAAPFASVNKFRAYDQHNGFGLHWVGADAIVEPDPVGATVSLRFGPSAAIYTGSPDNELGLTNVKQAFASYKPGGAAGKLTLVAGKFDTIYGAEVADSQLNVTYTRSALNFFAQPFFHTGVRADYQLTDAYQLRAMIVNGWNNAVDNNLGKSFGLQFNVKPNDKILLAIGYLGGPEQADRAVDDAGVVYNRPSINKRFRHLADVVLDWTPTDRFRALFNYDWATDDIRPFGGEAQRVVWWGADLTLRGKINDLAFVGVRGSYVHDYKGFLFGTGRDTRITSATVTLGLTPTPNLMFKLEPRLDHSNEEDFVVGTNGTSNVQGTIILGVVATTN